MEKNGRAVAGPSWKKIWEPADLASRPTFALTCCISPENFLFLPGVRGSTNKLRRLKWKRNDSFQLFKLPPPRFFFNLHWVLARPQLNFTLNHHRRWLCESVSHFLKNNLAVCNKSTLIIGNYPKERLKHAHKNIQARMFLLHYSEH